MVTTYRRDAFINYPEPMKGPDVPYKDGRKTNPIIKGPSLAVSAFIMEWVRWVREAAWWNAGFGSLRAIFDDLAHYEPFYEPAIVPLGPSAAELKEQEASQAAILGIEQSPLPASRYPESRYYSVADYHQLYLSGELTPTQVAQTLLPLIRRDINPRGRHSEAWMDVKAEMVLRAAEAATRRYAEKRPLGLLDGVPTAVKDEYDMEHYNNYLGSRHNYAGDILEEGSNTSWCVRKLEGAGCVILGKLHMVEFGLDTPGNNPFWGTPRNPYNPGYYTGGSSSGSGYAVGAGLLPFALGSDGGGSIRIPSSFCSVFGLKPTHGRLATRPGQNHCATCSSLGPLAADMRSLAAVYSVIAQPHPSSPFPKVPSPELLLASAPQRTKVIGIYESWFAQATPAVQHLCRSMINNLVQSYGYIVVPITIPYLVEGQVAHAMTILNDAKTLLPDSTGLNPVTKILLALGTVTPAADFLLAQKLRRLLMQHLSYLWQQHPGMVIITPTTACAGWPIRSQSELKWGISDADTTLKSMEYVWLANYCGLPSLTVPAGYVIPVGRAHVGEIASKDTEGAVPVGIMATGEWASEADLLKVGLDLEAIGAERRTRSGIWEDVIQQAKENQ